MSNHQSRAVDRLVRIELLRARAALERDSLAARADQLCDALDPKLWFGRLTGARGGNLLLQGVSLLRRYPFLTSALSTLLLGKRWRLLKWGGAALAAVLAARATRGRRDSNES